MNPLPGVANFRDAAGLATGSLRRGAVFRSAQLSGLSPHDGETLLGLGVRHVFDLRTAEEAAHRPDAVPAALRPVLLDVLADRPHSGAAAVAGLVNAHAEKAPIADVNAAVEDGRARDLMIETYRYLVSLPSAHAGYRRLLTTVAASEGASVIHCTAGKDRTGWAIAVLQLLAGASMDDVVDDYLGSNEPMRQEYGPMLELFGAAGGDADALADMIYVRPEYLEAAVELMRRVHTDLAGYLRTGLGLDSATIARLLERLTGG